MTHGHPALPAKALGAADDLIQSHLVGVEVKVEVKVQIAIVFLCQSKQPFNLAVRVAIGIGAAAEQVCTLLQCTHQQGLGARIVEHTFLREYANL